MRALILLVACACSHRAATSAPPAETPPATVSASIAPRDAAQLDAPLPTATTDWHRDEVSPAAREGSAETPRDKIRAKVAQLRRCYGDAGVMPTGAVVVVNSAGQVTDVHVHGGDDDTSDCVDRMLRTMHFDGGPVEMLIPFTE